MTVLYQHNLQAGAQNDLLVINVNMSAASIEAEQVQIPSTSLLVP